jgi:cobalt-zinc-cadmium efflux system membrane fusion protein
VSAATHEIDPLPTAQRLPKERQRRIILMVAGAIIAVVLLIAFINWLETPPPPPVDNTPPGAFRATQAQLSQMKIEPVHDGSAIGYVDATGIISVNEDQSTPVILPYSGQVTDVFVAAGQRVSRGQPLLRVASSDFVDARSAMLSAAAQQATATSQFQVATDNAARQQQIYETAGGALKDYRQAQSDLVAARATLAAANASVTATRDRLALLGKSSAQIGKMSSNNAVAQSTTTYTAPVSGIIAARNVAPGQFVGSGNSQPLMTIANLSDVWLVAQLPESAAASVRVGDPVTVTTPAYPGRQFHAVINNIAASLDPVTHRLPVRATVSNTDYTLKPQMFASFRIERRGAGPAGILVPSNAVIHEGDSARVWVLGRGGLLWGRSVVVGDSADGWDRIISGLKPGERVVTSGAIFVNEAGLAG